MSFVCAFRKKYNNVRNIVLFLPINATRALFHLEFLLLTGRYVKNNKGDKDLNEIAGAVGTRATEHHHLARRR